MNRSRILSVCRGLAAFAALAAVAWAQNPNRLPGMPYLNGTSVPWRNFGQDFGGNGTLYDGAFWASTFADLKAYKVNAARVWVHVDGSASPTFNASGDVTGLPATFLSEMTDLLNKADANGIKIMLTLWSFDMCKDYRATRGPAAGMHASLITTPSYRTNYINRVLIPLVNQIKNHPALAYIDLCNEPEWMAQEESGGDVAQKVPLSALRAFFIECGNAIKANAPNMLYTVGSASVKWSTANGKDSTVGDWWAGCGFPLRDVHYYSWMIGADYNFDPFNSAHTPAYYGFEGKPAIIGEFGGKGNAPYNNGLEQMNRAWNNGYAGSFSWAYVAGRHPDDMAENGYWPEFRSSHLTFANNHNLGGGTPDTTAPSVPTNLSSPSKTDTTVNLTWTASTDNVGVTGYDVLRSGTVIGSPTGTSYTATGLTASTAYSFTVRAKDAAGNLSAASTALSVTTNAAPPPSNVVQAESGTYGGGAALQSASNAGGGQVIGAINNQGAYSQITRSATAAGTHSLTIRYSNGYSSARSLSLIVNGTRLQSVSFAPTGGWNTFANASAININLNAGSNTIRLERTSVDVAAADIDSYTITGGTSGGDTTAPSVPTNLTSPSKTSNSVSLSWTASTDNVGVTGYDVLRGGTVVGNPTGTSFTDTGLAASTTYSYTVKAKDAAGNASAASAALSVTTNAASGGGTAKAEAEAGTLTGCSTASSLAGYSGTGYVDATTFNASPDAITVTVNVATAGTYTVRIRYAGPVGDKYQTLIVNGVDKGAKFFPASSGWTNLDVTGIALNAGANTIKLQASWGWDHIDFIEVF